MSVASDACRNYNWKILFGSEVLVVLTSNFANLAVRTLAGEKFHCLENCTVVVLEYFLSITSFLSNGITNQGITFMGISNNHNFHFPFHINKLK